MSSILKKYSNSKVAIRPFVDNTKSNMGLENYELVVFPGTHQTDTLACISQNGKNRYINGLDEFAPEIKTISDPKEREAKAKEIRTIVAKLELEKVYNHIEIDDPEFWNKATTFRPDNSEFWNKINVTLNNDPIYLDPVNNLDHLIIVLGVEAGGFNEVAKSYEDAKNSRIAKKWYLDRQIDTVSAKITVTRHKNKALTLLQDLYEESPRKLNYVAKNVDLNSVQYKKNTLLDVIYQNMDAFICGKGFEKDITKASKTFIEYAEMDLEDLIIKSIIKDATFYKYIILKGDGLFYTNDNEMVGRNSAEIYEFFKNPINQDVLQRVRKKVDSMYNS